jgi:flavodoxin
MGIEMSTLVLVGYATRYGSTQEVAQADAAALSECGLSVELQLLREVRVLTGYGAIVMDAPLKWFAGDEPSSDIRDWTAIRAWAGDLSEKFKHVLS